MSTRGGEALRLLAMGHGAAATGFARVLDGILRHLPPRYEIHHLALNHKTDRVEGPFPIYGSPSSEDVLGGARLAELVGVLEPQIVLLVGDLWHMASWLEGLSRHPQRPLVVGYCPVDGELLDATYAPALRKLDKIVVYNRFGLSQLRRIEQMFAEAEEPGFCFGDIAVIPHGVDTETFRPLHGGDRRRARSELFGPGRGMDDAFIVFNGNKHQPRKRLDITLQGFAAFAANKPESVKLYLHTKVDLQGPDVQQMAKTLGISHRLLLSEGSEARVPAVDDARLNLLYNACDVGVNTSSGEGWGLISFEHAATSAPQIVPRHSAPAELWEGAARLLEPVKSVEHTLGMLRYYVDPAEVAAGLERLYADRTYYAAMASAARERALSPAYRWKSIGEAWDHLLQELTSGRARSRGGS
jgi:D-inositol-3-phosphate glycosyltransferase